MQIINATPEDQNVLARTCDAALRSSGINALRDVTIIQAGVVLEKKGEKDAAETNNKRSAAGANKSTS